DYFHPVPQRRGHGIHVVRRRDKNHLRQVERHVEIMIHECMVLPWVEDFEQGAGGIPAEIGANLVDLVEHQHGVPRAGTAKLLDEPARHRTDIGAPVPADLRLVAYPAQAHPGKLAPERVGDRLPETCFSDTWRTEE